MQCNGHRPAGFPMPDLLFLPISMAALIALWQVSLPLADTWSPSSWWPCCSAIRCWDALRRNGSIRGRVLLVVGFGRA